MTIMETIMMIAKLMIMMIATIMMTAITIKAI